MEIEESQKKQRCRFLMKQKVKEPYSFKLMEIQSAFGGKKMKISMIPLSNTDKVVVISTGELGFNIWI